jgi:cytochrome P450
MSTSPAAKVPAGPRGHWLWGSLQERRKTPLEMLSRGFAEYGDVVRFRMAHIRVTLFAHPDHIKHIMVDNPARYSKGPQLRNAKPLLGEGLLLAEGPLWKRQRRLAQPAFHRERINGLVDQMAQATRDLLRRWDAMPDGTVVDMGAEMMRLTMAIVARTLFSSDVTGDTEAIGAAITTAVHTTNDRVLSLNPLKLVLPSRANREFDKALAVLDRAVLGIIEARRKDPNPPQDLLSMLMAARDEETQEAMSDRQLRDEVMTLFLAGHETTANALTWTSWLLDRNPDAVERMRAEADAVLGDRDPTAQDLRKLEFTGRVFDEGMRLYPPAWVIGRFVEEDDVIGGYEVPKGSITAVSPWVTHRHPAFWENPEKFDPDHFLPERVAKRPKLAYFPFGAGQRMCIGNTFALMEGQLILSMLSRRYRWTSVTGQAPVPDPLITLRPGPTPMRLERRKGPASA